MVDRCPRCEYLFDREDGFWLGAIAINLVITEGLLGILMVALIVWETAHEAGGLSLAPWIETASVLAVVVPVLFYPFSKTIWTAIELIMHGERFEAEADSSA